MTERPVAVAVKPRGRPKAVEPCTSLSVWFPCREYDRLVKIANQREQSVSSLVRSMLILRLKP
jgi:hypothetical protein